MLTSIPGFKIRLFGNPEKGKDRHPPDLEGFCRRGGRGLVAHTSATEAVRIARIPPCFTLSGCCEPGYFPPRASPEVPAVHPTCNYLLAIAAVSKRSRRGLLFSISHGNSAPWPRLAQISITKADAVWLLHTPTPPLCLGFADKQLSRAFYSNWTPRVVLEPPPTLTCEGCPCAADF